LGTVVRREKKEKTKHPGFTLKNRQKSLGKRTRSPGVWVLEYTHGNRPIHSPMREGGGFKPGAIGATKGNTVKQNPGGALPDLMKKMREGRGVKRRLRSHPNNVLGG